MPVIEEVSGDSLVTLNWSIENFSLNVCNLGRSILSPKYEFKKLGDARWQLELFPKGSISDDHVACYLWTEMDDTTGECDTYNITLSLPVGDGDLFEKQCTHTFDGTDAWKCNEFIRIDLLKGQYLPNDVFTIKCKIYPEYNPRVRSDQQDFEILSRDLTSLLESQAHHDLVLETADTEFKVHKSILAVRWPMLMDTFDIEGGFANVPYSVRVPDTTDSNTLKTLIRYAYSGIIEGPNVPREVYKTAVMYDFATLRKNLAVYPKEYFGISDFDIEHKTVIWHLDDVSSWDRTPLSFIRILPIVELYVREVIITFSTTKDPDGDEAIDIAFRLSYFKEEFPVFMNCKMRLSVQTGETQTHLVADHLFRTAEGWHFPPFIKKSDIVDKTQSVITMELTMCDGPKSSRIVKTETEFFTDFTPVQDLRKLSTDLSMLSHSSINFPSDSNLLCKDGKKVPVHHAIIWARWPELRHAFDARIADDNDFSVELDIEESLLEAVILYIYSGSSEEIKIETAQLILEASKSVPFPKSLEQKCKAILEKSFEE